MRAVIIGSLKGASDEIRESIIQGRIESLQKQIKKQTGELQKIEGLLKERGGWRENKCFKIKKYS